MRRDISLPIRPEIPAPSMKAMPPTAPLASTALRPNPMTTARVTVMRDPTIIGLAMTGMLAHHHVDKDDGDAKEEPLQTTDRCLALKVNFGL